MFIEPSAQKEFEALKERNIWLPERHIVLLRSLEGLSGDLSYKHLAAMRPGHDSSWNLRDTAKLKPRSSFPCPCP